MPSITKAWKKAVGFESPHGKRMSPPIVLARRFVSVVFRIG